MDVRFYLPSARGFLGRFHEGFSLYTVANPIIHYHPIGSSSHLTFVGGQLQGHRCNPPHWHSRPGQRIPGKAKDQAGRGQTRCQGWKPTDPQNIQKDKAKCFSLPIWTLTRDGLTGPFLGLDFLLSHGTCAGPAAWCGPLRYFGGRWRHRGTGSAVPQWTFGRGRRRQELLGWDLGRRVQTGAIVGFGDVI